MAGSKQRFTTERLQEIGELRPALKRLLDKLPDKFKTDADARRAGTSHDGLNPGVRTPGMQIHDLTD